MISRLAIAFVVLLLVASCQQDQVDSIVDSGDDEQPEDIGPSFYLDSARIHITKDTIDCEISYHFTYQGGLIDTFIINVDSHSVRLSTGYNAPVTIDEIHTYHYRDGWSTSRGVGDSTNVYYTVMGFVPRADSASLGPSRFMYFGFQRVVLST